MSNGNYKIMNNATPQLTIRSETTKDPTVAIMGINMLVYIVVVVKFLQRTVL